MDWTKALNIDLSLSRSDGLPRRLSQSELCDFSEALSTLVGSGLPLDYSLETLQTLLEKPALKRLAAFLLHQIRQGHSLSYSLGLTGGLFNEAYMGMVRAGEMSGTLDKVLAELTEGLVRIRDMRSHILSSLIYPSMLLLVGGAAVVFILTFVLPNFVSVFADMKVELPPSAKALMMVGNFVEAYGWYLGLGLALLVILAVVMLRRPDVRRALGRVVMSLGPMGRLVREWQTVLYCRTLGLLINGGVPVNEACRFAAGAAGNLAFRESLMEVAGELKTGKRLAPALKTSPYLPAVALRLVAMGDETGDTGQMCLKASEFLERRVKNALQRMITLIEPAIILFMGVMVGFIVVTMLTTILTLTQGGL